MADYSPNWPGAAPEGNGRSLSSESRKEERPTSKTLSVWLQLLLPPLMIHLVTSHFVSAAFSRWNPRNSVYTYIVFISMVAKGSLICQLFYRSSYMGASLNKDVKLNVFHWCLPGKVYHATAFNCWVLKLAESEWGKLQAGCIMAAISFGNFAPSPLMYTYKQTTLSTARYQIPS